MFAPSDSSGNPYPNGAWALADELISAGHLFVVGPVQPPASQIALSIADVLVATPDPRAGRDPKWHKIIRTPVDLQMTTDSGGSPAVSWVSGYALFYLVRGDSASIPPRLVALGWTPDSTRWWIQRWEDETAGASGSPADVKPVQNLTWGAVKARYR